MAAGNQAEFLGPGRMSHALSEVGDDASSEWVAADGGELLPEEVGGARNVANCSGCESL